MCHRRVSRNSKLLKVVHYKLDSASCYTKAKKHSVWKILNRISVHGENKKRYPQLNSNKNLMCKCLAKQVCLKRTTIVRSRKRATRHLLSRKKEIAKKEER